MGIIYLFIVLAAVTLVGRVVTAAGVMLDDFVELFSSTVNNAGGIVGDYFEYAFSLVDWNGNFFETVGEVLDSDWIGNTVVGFFETLDVAVADFGANAQAIVATFVGVIRTNLIWAVVLVVIGVALANFVTLKVLRHVSASRGVVKMIVAWIFQTVIVTAVTVLAVYLAAVFAPVLPLAVTVYIILTCFLSLLGAWVVHGRKELHIREIVNVKNILFYFLSSVIIWLISVAAALLVWLVFGALVAVLVAVPLALYTGNIVGVNAESYVLSRAEEAQGNGKEEAQAEEQTGENAQNVDR